LVALLLTLAVIVFVSPGIVGRLAEKSVEENLEFAVSENDEVVITTESFSRGWFTSEGRHRIMLRDGPVSAFFVNAAGNHDRAPALIVDTHVDHGLVPVTSMSRDSGSLKPGLASTVSTMMLDPGNGELVDIPGKIYSDVGLTGETSSRFLLQAGSREDKAAEWQGADITVNANPSTGSVAVKGRVLPWSVLAEHGTMRSAGVAIEGHRETSRYGLGTGNVKLRMASLNIEDKLGPGIGFEKLSLDAGSNIDDDRVNAASRLDISGITTPGFGEIDVVMDIAFDGLDASSSYKIAQTLRSARASANPQDVMGQMYPQIEADLMKLLTTGFEIRFDQFDVTLPDGTLASKLRFDLPASDPNTAFSWPALLLALGASADIRLPVDLYDMAVALSPEAGTLVAMGFLRRDGDFYEMKAKYAKGLLTVNGAPMPIPMPGM
jgi:uncharacterized protein YdgA (DUF945 family)